VIAGTATRRNGVKEVVIVGEAPFVTEVNSTQTDLANAITSQIYALNEDGWREGPYYPDGYIRSGSSVQYANSLLSVGGLNYIDGSLRDTIRLFDADNEV